MLEGIGALAIIVFIIWIIDLIFFKEERVERIRMANSPHYTTISRQCNQCLHIISEEVEGNPKSYDIACPNCHNLLEVIIGTASYNKCQNCGNTKRNCPTCGEIFEPNEHLNLPI